MPGDRTFYLRIIDHDTVHLVLDGRVRFGLTCDTELAKRDRIYVYCVVRDPGTDKSAADFTREAWPHLDIWHGIPEDKIPELRTEIEA